MFMYHPAAILKTDLPNIMQNAHGYLPFMNAFHYFAEMLWSSAMLSHQVD